MHNQFKTQKFKHLMLAMGPMDLNSAPYSPVHCSSHSMMSFQPSELTELPVVENSQLFAQRTVRPLCCDLPATQLEDSISLGQGCCCACSPLLPSGRIWLPSVKQVSQSPAPVRPGLRGPMRCPMRDLHTGAPCTSHVRSLGRLKLSREWLPTAPPPRPLLLSLWDHLPLAAQGTTAPNSPPPIPALPPSAGGLLWSCGRRECAQNRGKSIAHRKRGCPLRGPAGGGGGGAHWRCRRAKKMTRKPPRPCCCETVQPLVG